MPSSYTRIRYTHALVHNVFTIVLFLLQKQLQFAKRLFDEAVVRNEQLTFDHLPVLSREVEENRWFLMPNEAHQYLTGQCVSPLTHFQLQIKEYIRRPSVPNTQRCVNNKHRKSSLKLLSELKPSSLTKRVSRDRLLHIQPSVENVSQDSTSTPGASKARLCRIMSFTLTTVEEPPIAMATTVLQTQKRWQSTSCIDSTDELGDEIDTLSVSGEDDHENGLQSSVVDGKVTKTVPVSKKRHRFLKLLKRLF